MNNVYYLLTAGIKNTDKFISGGHGYFYNTSKESKKKLQKNTPTDYGYNVGGRYQTSSVDPESFLTGYSVNSKCQGSAFLYHLIKLFELDEIQDAKKVLIITNSHAIVKALMANKPPKDIDEVLFKDGLKLYEDNKDKIIFDLELYPKGGEGVKHAANGINTAKAISELTSVQEIDIEIKTAKEFKDPEIDFNKLVTASRWFFNTGDLSNYYDVDDRGWRRYLFGRIDPDKGYYGKATPDVFYSVLYTKEPITTLDKLYDYSKECKPNPLNLLFAGNLNHIKSKEVARFINKFPGLYKGNELLSPVKIANTDAPVLVELINPPGLSYRIDDFHTSLDRIYKQFRARDINNKCKSMEFLDITNLFFVEDGKGKLKINPDFTNNTLEMKIKIKAPEVPNPVTIILSIKYDTPDRNGFNYLLNSKCEDIKVWLALDFSNFAGVAYSTIVSTKEFDYIHCNSIANLHVYSLKELGKK